MPARRVAQSCRVERWRGYFASSFFVRLPDGSVVESPSFRHRGVTDPPPCAAAQAALAALVDALTSEGWTAEPPSGRWFEVRLSRVADVELPEEARPPRPVAIAPPPPPPPPAVAATPPPRAPAPAAEPSPPVERRPRRRQALVAAVSAVLVAVGAVAAFALVDGRDAKGRAADTPKTTRSVASRPAPAPSRTTTTAPRPRAKLVDLRISAVGHGSWIELRRGSRTGAILYSATLLRGSTLHFRDARIWARFGAASNLSITVDGRRVPLEGTFDKLFVPIR